MAFPPSTLAPPCLPHAFPHFPHMEPQWQLFSLSLVSVPVPRLCLCLQGTPSSPSLCLPTFQEPVQLSLLFLWLPLISVIFASLLLYHALRNITQYCRISKWFMLLPLTRFIPFQTIHQIACSVSDTENLMTLSIRRGAIIPGSANRASAGSVGELLFLTLNFLSPLRKNIPVFFWVFPKLSVHVVWAADRPSLNEEWACDRGLATERTALVHRWVCEPS